MKFRPLRADEIECRIGMEKDNGVSILLYKDARCDMNILDESVGAENWKKDYQLIDGQLFCTVYIWDKEKSEWIGKQDVGTENRTEAEKSRASDAQKRACSAWGLGRELYTAPFVWIKSEHYKTGYNGKCSDHFKVAKIKYDENKNIVALAIINESNNKIVFVYQKDE